MNLHLPSKSDALEKKKKNKPRVLRCFFLQSISFPYTTFTTSSTNPDFLLPLPSSVRECSIANFTFCILLQQRIQNKYYQISLYKMYTFRKAADIQPSQYTNSRRAKQAEEVEIFLSVQKEQSFALFEPELKLKRNLS